MDMTGSKVTVKVEEPNLEGGGSTAVIPLQQVACLPAGRFALVRACGAPATISISIGDQHSEAKADEDKREKAVKAKVMYRRP